MLTFLQVYKAIFTSPSSAKGLPDEEEGDENAPPPAKSPRGSSRKKTVRRNVASKVQLNNKVTPRSIAYAAVQVNPFPFHSALAAGCLLALISCTSTCRQHPRGLKFTEGSITVGCIIMLLISSKKPQGLLQRSVPKIYLPGGPSK